jgi:cell division inhibitor SulA
MMGIFNTESKHLVETILLNTPSEDDLNSHFELIKIIKRYEYCCGWTLLIAPDHLPKKDILTHHNINLDKVLIVHKKHCTDILFTAYQGLRNENCSALVIWDGLINQSEYALLNAKAKSVNTALYLLNKNTHDQAIVHH